MKTIGIASMLLLAAAAAAAQEEGVQTTGRIETGAQLLDNDTGSSRLNEYRDLRNSVYIPGLSLDVSDGRNGRFLELRGEGVSRDDQALGLRLGSAGRWGLDLSWNEIPHLLSNRAQSPLTHDGRGLLQAPSTIPVTFKKLATSGSADALRVVESDDLTAAYLPGALRSTDLGTQRDRGSIELRYTALDAIKLRLGYQNEGKSGSKASFGPIGDRPPRTLNIQLAEPVDFRTQDLELEAEHVGKGYEVQLSYLRSDFANSIDTLTWQNVYAAPTLRPDTDAWDRALSTFGRRPLAPDNQYQNATVVFGVGLPLDSRLTATAAYGRLEQDQELLPYSFNSGILVNQTLPRTTADARIDTSHFQAVYSISPVQRLDVRASYRYYDLDNKTPEDHWQYVTSDTPNTNGTVTFKNKRVNDPFAYGTRSARLEATYRPAFWRSSVAVGYEREQIERTHREADTTEENRLSATWRARPAHGLMLRARYLYGKRDGGEYDWAAPRESYWYSASEVGSDNDNPQFAFLNHPDMRRYDLSDRKRQQLDGSLSLTRSTVTATAGLRYRKDDFDSGVKPIQPLLGTGREESATTPGDQLGRLDDERLQYTVDLGWSPSARFSANVFASREDATGRQRGLEFNENNKMNPSTQVTAELGPWTRATSQWTADIEDSTTSVGLSARYTLVPDKVTVAANATSVRGTVDIAYAGWGVTNWDGTPYPDTHQFGFRTPPTMRNDADVFGLSLEYRLNARVGVSAGYAFDRFRLADWQQESDTPWREAVGSEYLIRDTSRSNQWGNRLISLGRYLAPGYEAHIGHVTLTYRF